MARSKDVLLRLKGDASDGRRAVREMRQEMRSLAREHATVSVDVRTEGVKAQLQLLEQRLQRLSKQEATPTVKIRMARVTEQIDRLKLKLDRLDHERVNIDVDVKRGALERTASGLGKLERGVQGVSQGFADVFHQVPLVGGLLESVFGGAFTLATNLGNAVTSLATSGVGALARMLGSTGALAGPIGAAAGQVASLGASIAAVGAIGGGLIIVLNAVVGAVIALGGALVALVASAAAATAGLGAMAIAFGAALIPAAVVAFGVFQCFQAILKAHQAQQQKVAQATQDAKTAEQAHTAALQQRQQAERQLADATVAARNAMAQAARDETDAELGLRNARNGVQDSRLQLALAKRDLREFLKQAGATGPALNALTKKFTNVDFDPSQAGRSLGALTGGAKKVDPLDLRQKIQAVRDAQLGVANATNQVTHAEDNLGAARRKEADFTQRGLRAYAPYRNALAAVARANQRVARTQDQTSAAQRKYEQALKGLSGTEQGTLGRLNQLLDGFKKLAKAFSDPVFKALNDVFDKLKGHAGDFTGVLAKVGDAFGNVIRAIGSFLTEPATLSAFKTMASGAADLVHQLGARAFTSFLRIMRDVATTALPTVVRYAHRFADALAGVAANSDGVRGVVRGLLHQFSTWASLGWQVLRSVAGIFRAAVVPGGKLATHLTTIVKNFADWANSDAGQKKLRDFFADAIKKAKSIVTWIKNAAVWLKNHLPSAAAKAKAAFESLKPIFNDLLKIADGINKAVQGWKDIKEFVAPGTNKLSQAAHDVPEQIATVNRLAGQLQLHQTPAHRATLRKELAQALRDLRAQGQLKGPLPQLLSRLKALGFASGGVVGGSGSGDVIPAMLEPGEFVMRRAAVNALGSSFFEKLNSTLGGGGMLQLLPSGGTGPATTIRHQGDNHFHISAPGGRGPDARSVAADLEREVWKGTVR